MLHVEMERSQLRGLPVGLFSDKLLLMRTNGAIEFLDNQAIRAQKITQAPFHSQDQSSMARELQEEFGGKYRVRRAGPYLVVATPGRVGVWSDRFLKFHHSIELFCTTHRIPLRKLEFSLVAIVFETKREFDAYARTDQAEIPETCVGYYSQKTNRIVLFDADSGGPGQQTLETICHEATHQVAFNSGLHQRLAETPLWLAEGFAVQFEAPAYCNYGSRDHASRWPESQRRAWESMKGDPKRLQSFLNDLILDDRRFRTDTLDAYTVSWALTSYLADRKSREFVQFLQNIGRRKPFETYTAGDRLRDFHQSFGTDVGLLSRRITEHLEQLD